MGQADRCSWNNQCPVMFVCLCPLAAYSLICIITTPTCQRVSMCPTAHSTFLTLLNATQKVQKEL